jgi:phosphoglycerate dehydrogenase-like enzyme
VADRLLRQGRWAKHELHGRLLRGKVLGIVGCGNIGSRVGELAAAWGMRPIGCVEHLTDHAIRRLRDRRIQPASFRQVLRESHFVSVHCPYGPSTHHLIGRDALAQMRPDALIVNVARGNVVDEDALYDALVEGRLAGAGLDVHCREGAGEISRLAALDNVVLTPHIGATTVDTQREIGERLLATLQAFAERQRCVDADSSQTVAGPAEAVTVQGTAATAATAEAAAAVRAEGALAEGAANHTRLPFAKHVA